LRLSLAANRFLRVKDTRLYTIGLTDKIGIINLAA
jgi:hypothetical protein